MAVVAAAGATVWAWTAPAPVGASVCAAALAALPLAAVMTARGRDAAAALARTYRISLIVLCAALLALLAPAISAGTADVRAAAALRTIALIAGLGLGAFGVAALVAAGRWRPVNAALLAAGATAAVVSAGLGALRGDADAFALFADRDAGLAFFGLVATQALVTLGDELGRRTPMNGRAQLAPLSRRTLIPVLAGLTAALMLAGGGSGIGAAIAVATLALAAAAWTLREKRTGARAFRLGAAVLAVLAAALAWPWIAGADGSALQAWAAPLGGIGAAGVAIAVLTVLAQIAMAEDRGRRPARGFALALGAAALVGMAALLSPTAAAAPVVAWAALQLGLAAGVVDLDLRRQRAGQLVAATT